MPIPSYSSPTPWSQTEGRTPRQLIDHVGQYAETAATAAKLEGVDAGVYHGAEETVTNTSGNKTYLDGFDAGWRNGDPSGATFVPRQSGLEIVQPGLYIVTANLYGYNGAASLPVAWGVNVDQAGGSMVQDQDLCDSAGVVFGTACIYKWFYDPGKLTFWITHADPSMAFYCSVGALLLSRDVSEGEDLGTLPA